MSGMSYEHQVESNLREIACFHVWDLDQDNMATIGYRCARCCVFQKVEDVRAFQSTLTPEIPEVDLWSFVRDIEAGRVTLAPVREPSDVQMGRVEYRASNGWTVVVFNDCNSWDYFDRFESHDGRVVTLTTMPEAIQSYRPDIDVAVMRYQFTRTVHNDCRRAG